MNCRRCNTPIPSRSSSCPNCGQHAAAGESFIDDPGESGVQDASAVEESLMSSSLMDGSEIDSDLGEDADELSLDDAVEQPEVSAPAKPAVSATPGTRSKGVSRSTPARPAAAAKAGPKSGASKSRAAGVSKPKPKQKKAKAQPERSDVANSGSLLPDAETVRNILARHPELVEPGLEVLTDDGGAEIGVQHVTDVGTIDLLARDASGDLVVVLVHGADSDVDPVADALHRIGWVRKHLTKDGEGVRGVVLCEHLDEDAAYAAAAVSGTVAFKSYALSLSLVDLDI